METSAKTAAGVEEVSPSLHVHKVGHLFKRPEIPKHSDLVEVVREIKLAVLKNT